MPHFRFLLRLSHPVNLFLVALTYMLGVGIARYLGVFDNLPAFWLGLAGVLTAQFSMSLMVEAFRPVTEPSLAEENKSERVVIRRSSLLVAIGALAVSALIFILLGKEGALSPTAVLFIGFSLALVFAYSVPPFHLENSGFGEFALSVHIAVLVPALGFIFQYHIYHRLVAIVSFPLTLLALAYFLTATFPTYAVDQKFDRRTLLRRMGWERAVPFHHGLVVGAYLLMVGALQFGLAWKLVWPVFLTFPFALMQILWLRNISLGAKPLWTLLTVNSLAVFALTTYLLAFAFWLR
jgi:1,4-dihydroxy-2-naphthoate octaprenyltransferase